MPINSRSRKILELATERPELTNAEIGEIVGTTRHWVGKVKSKARNREPG